MQNFGIWICRSIIRSPALWRVSPDGLHARRLHSPSQANEAISHISTRTKSFRVRELTEAGAVSTRGCNPTFIGTTAAGAYAGDPQERVAPDTRPHPSGPSLPPPG